MIKKAGVYEIRNIITNERYIGSSGNINQRVKRHWIRLREGIHSNKPLQRAYDSFGRSAFRIQILELCVPKFLKIAEQKYLNDGFDTLYNVRESTRNTQRVYSEEEFQRALSGPKGRRYRFVRFTKTGRAPVYMTSTQIERTLDPDKMRLIRVGGSYTIKQGTYEGYTVTFVDKNEK